MDWYTQGLRGTDLEDMKPSTQPPLYTKNQSETPKDQSSAYFPSSCHGPRLAKQEHAYPQNLPPSVMEACRTITPVYPDPQSDH